MPIQEAAGWFGRAAVRPPGAGPFSVGSRNTQRDMGTSIDNSSQQPPGRAESPAGVQDGIAERPAERDGTAYQPAIGVLRVAAAFGVVALHTSGMAFTGTPHGSAAWWIADFYHAATHWCVPVFVMISGALLLRPARPLPMAAFYRKRMSRILIPLAFWTVFYTGWQACFEGISLQYVARGLIRGNPYGHLWYLYMIAGLYFITPILQAFVRGTSRREQIAIVAPLLAAAAGHDLINMLTAGAGKPTLVSRFVPYIPYYAAGYLLSQTAVPRRGLKYLVVGALAGWLGVAFGTGVLWPRVESYFFGANCPLIIGMSLAVFLTTFGLFGPDRTGSGRCRQIMRFLDDTSLGIYLVHPLFITLLMELGLHSRYIVSHPLPSIPIASALIFLASALLASLLKSLPGLRRVV